MKNKYFYLKYEFDLGPPMYISDINLEQFLEDHKVGKDYAIDKWFQNDLNYNPFNAYMLSELEFDKAGDLVFVTLKEVMEGRTYEQ